MACSELPANSTVTHSTASTIAEACGLLITLLFAVVSNVTAIATILRVQSLRRTPHNLLIFNLCVADLAFCVVVGPMSLLSILNDGEFFMYHCKGCKLYGFVLHYFVTVRNLTLMVIAIDRVIVVTSCRLCNRFCSGLLRVRIMNTVCWLVPALGVTLITFDVFAPVGITIKYKPIMQQCVLSLDSKRAKKGFLGAFILIPFTIITCYATITVSLVKQSRKLLEQQKIGLTRTAISGPRPTSPRRLRKVTFDIKSVISDRRSSDAGATIGDIGSASKRAPCPIEAGEPSSKSQYGGIGHLDNVPGNVTIKDTVQQIDDEVSPQRIKLPVQTDTKMNASDIKEPSENGDLVSWITCAEGDAIHDDRNLSLQDSTTECGAAIIETKTRFRNRSNVHVIDERTDAFDRKKSNSRMFTENNPMNAEVQPEFSGAYNDMIPTDIERRKRCCCLMCGYVDMDADDFSFYIDMESLTRASSMNTLAVVTTSNHAGAGAEHDRNHRSHHASRQTRRRLRKTKLMKMQYEAQRRVAVMGVVLLFCALFGLLPSIVVLHLNNPPWWTGALAHCFLYVVAVLDPLVYAFMNKRLQEELRRYAFALSRACRACATAKHNFKP